MIDLNMRYKRIWVRLSHHNANKTKYLQKYNGNSSQNCNMATWNNFKWYLQNATQLIKRFHLVNLPPLSLRLKNTEKAKKHTQLFLEMCFFSLYEIAFAPGNVWDSNWCYVILSTWHFLAIT